ncbi:MAG: Flp pilus assembly protein CpaB [Rhodospirillales bacterium]
MQSRTLIFALLALLIGGGTAYFVHSWLSAQKQQPIQVAKAPPPPVGKMVLVASKNLPAGSFIKPDSVRWQPWPEGGVAPTYALRGARTAEEFHGAVVRQGITAGEPVTDMRIVKPNDRGFLAAVLAPGMRAISVAVNATSSVSGLVFPGDRVDLILAHRFRAGEEDGGQRKATETVMRNLRIIAIDQKTNDQENKPQVAKTITFEVSPKQAEEVTLAAELGKLSLALQSIAAEDGEEPNAKPAVDVPTGHTFTRDTEVSRLLRSSDGQFVNLIRGSKSETITVGEPQ